MNLEDLSKHQLLLLALLVSFVTSLATGIVTVSMMDYAPPAVTKTVNRVVEHTIERVVPPDEIQEVDPTERVTEKVVVVERDASLEEAVSSVSDGIVRTYLSGDDTASSSGKFTGFGLVLNEDGLVAADKSLGAVSYVHDLSGKRYDATLVREETSFAYYRVESEDGSVPASVPIREGKPLALGSEVFALSGGNSLSLSRGTITQTFGANIAGAAGSISESLKTDIIPPQAGVPLFTSDGYVVALSGKKGEGYTFIPIETILEASSEVSVESEETPAS
ncbi:MAG: serine protease [Candidatus Paceibacterota bacterium]